MKWAYPTDPWPDEILTNCCGDKFVDESDLCARCLEHAASSEIDDDEYGDFLYHKRKDDEL